MAALDEVPIELLLAHLIDVGIARCACVCKHWRAVAGTPAAWRAAFINLFGEHSARWADAHEPVAALCSNVWRARCQARRRAAAMRLSGLCCWRTLPFDFGVTPSTSSFFVSSLALDGPWLALGEHSGRTSLWDLRTGKARWRAMHELPPPLEGYGAWQVEPLADGTLSDAAIHEIHVCAVGGRVATLTGTGLVLVRALETGEVRHRIDHHRLLPPPPPLRAADVMVGLEGEEAHGAALPPPPPAAAHGANASLALPSHVPRLRGVARICLYSAERLAGADGLGGARLMSVSDLPQPGSMAYPFCGDDGPLALLWLLPEPGAASDGSPRLLRARRGLMSEQGGVIAELRASLPTWHDGGGGPPVVRPPTATTAVAPGSVRNAGDGGASAAVAASAAASASASASAASVGSCWECELLLLELMTLTPLGVATLRVPPAFALNGGDAPLALSIQRRTDTYARAGARNGQQAGRHASSHADWTGGA